MNKQVKKVAAKSKRAHGSPCPTAARTPKVHDRWVAVQGEGRWACGCGWRSGDYWGWVEHTKGCRKGGGV